jgi:hypothetical protein
MASPGRSILREGGLEFAYVALLSTCVTGFGGTLD